MLLVMIHHLSFKPKIYDALYGPFFLSMFLFISGYLFSPKENFKSYFKRKTEILLVPFIVLGLINIFLRHIITFNEKISFGIELKSFILQIGNGAGLWFIAYLYVASLIIYPLNKYIKSTKKYVITITFIAVVFHIYNVKVGIQIPWHIHKLGWAIFFMGMGKIYKEKLELKLSKYENTKMLVLLTLIYVLFLFVNYLIFKNIFLAVNYNINTNIIVQFILSLTSIWLLIIITKKYIKSKFIKFVGQNTLVYFAFHGKVQSLLLKILNKFIIFNEINGAFYSIVIMLVEALILIIPSNIINNYFPWILGQKTKIE